MLAEVTGYSLDGTARTEDTSDEEVLVAGTNNYFNPEQARR